MRPITTLALLAALAAPASTPCLADEPRGDLDRLQGTWTTKVGPNQDIPVALTMKGAEFEIMIDRPGGQASTLKGEVKVDEKAAPKTYDFVNLKGPKGEDFPNNLGIYKLEGDTWTTCSGGPGNERPSRFEAGNGGPPNLLTWARAKPAGEKPDKGDLEKFQGSWTAPAGPDDGAVLSMTVKGNAYTARWVKEDGSPVELRGELRVNDKAEPHKTIDFFRTKNGDDDARDSLGLYRFDGDKVTLCIGGPGDERPTEFRRGADGTPHILTFTRKKD